MPAENAGRLDDLDIVGGRYVQPDRLLDRHTHRNSAPCVINLNDVNVQSTEQLPG